MSLFSSCVCLELFYKIIDGQAQSYRKMIKGIDDCQVTHFVCSIYLFILKEHIKEAVLKLFDNH